MEHLALGKHILVEETNQDKMSEGGIYLADGTTQADSMRCRVVSVSEELVRANSEKGLIFPIEVGSVIYKAYHIGTPITTKDNKKLWAVHVDNLLSVEIE